MKRTILRVIVWFLLIIGILSVVLASLLCLLGLPAFMSTISGTTSLNMTSDDREVLQASFVMAAGGIMLLVQGVLNCFQGAFGKSALRHGDFSKFIFASGVVACSTLFEMMGGLYLSSTLTGILTIAFQAAIMLLAWNEQRTAGGQTKPDKTDESRE